MPCYDPEAPYDTIRGLNTKVQILTRLLCEMCKRADQHGLQFSAEARAWWTQHQAMDAERIAREAAEREQEAFKQATLAKLSAAERRALGLPT